MTATVIDGTALLTATGTTQAHSARAGSQLHLILDVTTIVSNNETVAIDSGGATSGTFTLDYDSEVTAAIAFDATAAEVQTALEALANIDAGDVVVTGTTVDADDIVIEFRGQYLATNVTDVTVGTDSTAGGTGIALTVTDPGTPTSPTLDVKIEHSHDGTVWADAASGDAFAQVTSSAASEALTVTARGRYYRARYTIGGTNPGYVCTLTAEATPPQ